MSSNEEARVILQPIVDLFTCADGGVAFATLRHSVLPAVIDSEIYTEQVYAFQNVSEICKNILALNDNVQRNPTSEGERCSPFLYHKSV